MATVQSLLPLSSPLATASQLSNSASSLDSIPASLERSLHYHGSLLTQSAGILLRLSQDIIAGAIITFQRFFVGPEGGSFRLHDLRDISSAAIYLAAKLSATPVSPRSVLNVYAYLLSSYSPLQDMPIQDSENPVDPSRYTLTEGAYQTQRLKLLENETLVLRTLGFTTKCVPPHQLALTYLQTLSLLPSSPTRSSKALATKTVALLNTALLSPQLLYLTHQPNALAVAAIYLAARETGVKIGVDEWWLLFDVEREELGHLAVALGSLEGYVREEAAVGKGCWTVEDVVAEISRT